MKGYTEMLEPYMQTIESNSNIRECNISHKSHKKRALFISATLVEKAETILVQVCLSTLFIVNIFLKKII